MTPTDDKAAPPRRPRLIMLLPLFVFVALAAVFLIRLETGGNPDAIPSALIGRPAPDFDLPPLDGVARPGLARADLEGGGVTVVNVFASWCGPCRIEHPQLMELAKDEGINLVAINYKDQPGNARRFLGDLGNPYSAIGVDPNGRAGIDWGLYGVPETFIIDATGTIRYKHIGPIGEDTLAEVIRPEIEKAMQPEG